MSKENSKKTNDCSSRLNPSLLSADFWNTSKALKMLEDLGVETLHIDIMDGHFVPNISFGPGVVKTIRKGSDLFFDTHLMISEPLKFIPKFVDAGSDSISVHVETEDSVDECLNLIKEAGIESGLVISPKTPVSALEPYLDRINRITVMSVEPGFGGQSYIPESTQKIMDIKDLIGDREIEIQVDGGVNEDTIAEIDGAGADKFVAGSAVFEGDVEANVNNLTQLIN